MNTTTPHIIMPIKDSIDMAERAIRAILATGHTLTVYDDNSTEENAARLLSLSTELGFTLIPLSVLTDHPSPNYRTVLIDAETQALHLQKPLLIVESDVIIKPDTITRLIAEADKHNKAEETNGKDRQNKAGLIAAITVDENEVVNYPYTEGKKHMSFCCTLLTLELMSACHFSEVLDPDKNWFDVTISHCSEDLGFRNILLRDCTVTHYPHSSRPWKQLKYSNPLLYYWRKLTQHKDKI